MSKKNVFTMFPEDEHNRNTEGVPEAPREASGKSPKSSDKEGAGPTEAGPDQLRKTTSQRQIEANRRNAGNSTGPRTEAGKRKSSRNSVKHGGLAKKILFDEDGLLEDEDLHDCYDRLCGEYSGDSLYAQFLRADMIVALHGYTRSIQLERLAANQPGYMYNLLLKLQRYHTAHRNALRQGFSELEQLRKADALREEIEAPEEYDRGQVGASMHGDDLEEEGNEFPDEEPLPWANGLTMAEYLDYKDACNLDDMLLSPEDLNWCEASDDDDDLRRLAGEDDPTPSPVSARPTAASHENIELECRPSSSVVEEAKRFIDSPPSGDIAQLSASDESIEGSSDRAPADADVLVRLQTGPNAEQPILPTETAEPTNEGCESPTLLQAAIEDPPNAIMKQQLPQSDRVLKPSGNCGPPSSAELIDSLSHIVAVDDDEGGSHAGSL